MSDFFISYAKEDWPHAQMLARALDESGWSVWWDRELIAGSRFEEVIEQELGKARCVVVLWSATSVASDWVRDEAREGNRRKILAPALIEQVQPPMGFRGVQTADLTHWRGEAGAPAFRTLCLGMRALVGMEGQARPTEAPAVDEAPSRPERATAQPDKPVSPFVTASAAPARRFDKRWVLGVALVAAVLAIVIVPRLPSVRGNKQGQASTVNGTGNVSLPDSQPRGGIRPTATGESGSQGANAGKFSTGDGAGTAVAVRTLTNPKDGLAYVWIPPGSFMMGCSPGDSECGSDEKPPRAEQIASGFWLGQTEVTQAAWEKVKVGKPSYFKRDQLPVESVDWVQANDYCRDIGGRLPTGKEWEYAARAGTAGARYGSLDAIAWYIDNSSATTHPVGLKQANAFGLYDMLGNVREWTTDDDHDETKVARGGSWRNVAFSFGSRAVY